MRRTLELVPVQGNGVSGRKTIINPLGLDYIAHLLVGVTATAAVVSSIKEKVNTELVRDITGSDQDNLNQEEKIGAMSVDNTLRIPYEQMGMKSIAQQYGTTRNTISADPETGNSISIYSHEWSDSTTDAWRVFVEADDATTGGPGAITRFLKVQPNVAASATYGASIASYLQFGIPERRFIRRMALLAAAGTLANGDTVMTRGKSKEEVFRRTAAMNTRQLTDANLRALPAAYAVASGGLFVDFTETGIAEMLDTMRPASDQEVKANVAGIVEMGGQKVLPYSMLDVRLSPSATGSVTAIVETVGRL